MALFKWQLKPDSTRIPDVISNIVLSPLRVQHMKGNNNCNINNAALVSWYRVLSDSFLICIPCS